MSVSFMSNIHTRGDEATHIRMKNDNDAIRLLDDYSNKNLPKLSLSDYELESLITEFKDLIMFTELNTKLLIVCRALLYYLNGSNNKISDAIVKKIYKVFEIKVSKNLKLKEDIYVYIKYIQCQSTGGFAIAPSGSGPPSDVSESDLGGPGEDPDFGDFDLGGPGEDPDFGDFDLGGPGEFDAPSEDPDFDDFFLYD